MRIITPKIFFLFFYIIVGVNLHAQYDVQIIENNDITNSFKVSDSSDIYVYLQEFLNKKHQQGYIAASFDSILQDSVTFKAYFVENEQFFWSNFELVNFTSNDKKYLKPKLFQGKPVNFNFLQKQVDKTILEYTNKGYPFAQITYDSLIFSDTTISTNIIISKNNFIKFDSVYFSDNLKVRSSFLQNYLNFNINDKYNQQIIDKIPDKLSNLSFVKVVMPPEIEFHKNSADLYLYLKNKRASQFSGIVGFSNANEKFSLVGEVDLKIINMFKNADKINLKWQKTKNLNQNLDLNLSFPYLFNTKIGFGNLLKIEKIDTSYIRVYNTASLLYYFSGFNNVALFSDFQTSIVFDTLSNYENFTSKLYGFSMNFYETNDFFLPSKGYIYQFSAGAGTKKTADSVSQQLSFVQNVEFYLPVFNSFVLMYRNFINILWSEYLFENELFKFGGASLMRGFDEESLRASFVNLNSLEVRYLLQNRTSVFLFTDYSIMQHKSISNNYWDHLVGVGTGFTLSTKNGLLSFTYAIGKTDNQKFVLKDSKVHFGFSAYF